MHTHHHIAIVNAHDFPTTNHTKYPNLPHTKGPPTIEHSQVTHNHTRTRAPVVRDEVGDARLPELLLPVAHSE